MAEKGPDTAASSLATCVQLWGPQAASLLCRSPPAVTPSSWSRELQPHPSLKFSAVQFQYDGEQASACDPAEGRALGSSGAQL